MLEDMARFKAAVLRSFCSARVLVDFQPRTMMTHLAKGKNLKYAALPNGRRVIKTSVIWI